MQNISRFSSIHTRLDQGKASGLLTRAGLTPVQCKRYIAGCIRNGVCNESYGNSGGCRDGDSGEWQC